jgi:hypothetical protein
MWLPWFAPTLFYNNTYYSLCSPYFYHKNESDIMWAVNLDPFPFLVQILCGYFRWITKHRFRAALVLLLIFLLPFYFCLLSEVTYQNTWHHCSNNFVQVLDPCILRIYLCVFPITDFNESIWGSNCNTKLYVYIPVYFYQQYKNEDHDNFWVRNKCWRVKLYNEKVHKYA